MQNPQARKVADLHAAAFAVGKHDLWFKTINSLSQVFSDLLRNLVFLFLKAKRSSQATTICINVVKLKTWDKSKNLKGGESNIKRP
jgi:hypothetical protein